MCPQVPQQVSEQPVPSPQLGLECPASPHCQPQPWAAAQAFTSGAVEARGAWVPTVGGDSLRTIVASRAGEAGGLASQVVVGTGRTRLGEAGAPGAEVALGTGAPLLQVS